MAGKNRCLAWVILAAVCAFGLEYLRDHVGYLRKPEAEYLTDEEASLRTVYKSLSPKEQAIYTALYRGIAEHKEKIPLPYDVDGELYSKVYRIVEKQEAEFFYLESFYYTAEKVHTARVAYRDDVGETADKASALDETVKQIAAAAPNGSDYNKILYLNDYLVNNCYYYSGDETSYCSTAYGCLVEGKASCEGYAKAFDCLAAECGLESALITGTADTGENHAWNQVKADGEWYNIDVTWGDTDKLNDIRRAYFLVDDAAFGKTHIADDEDYKPQKCEATADNYYIKNDLYVNTLADGEKIVRRELTDGRREIELKFADSAVYSEFKRAFFDEEYIFDVAEDCGIYMYGGMSVSIKEIADENCMKLEIE